MRVVAAMRAARSRGDGQQGAAAVIVALVLVVLFAMIVLTIDVGGLLLRRRGMVNAADAAALAAAKTCATDDDVSAPESQADLFAADNVAGLTAGQGGIIDIANCDNGIGYVTVEYTTPQQLIFAPVLGFGNTSPVPAKASAAWGPLASGAAVPIVVEAGTLQGPCQIPLSQSDPEPPADAECSLYYNNGDADLGDADWGIMNLNQWGVSPGTQCSNAGTSERRDWILNDYPDELRLSGDPLGSAPTYVCVDTGHSTTFEDIRDRMRVNDVLLFPVNDCTQQINHSGSGCDGTPDKYAIVGFVKLRVTAVYRGDDPAAIGTPGASGTCSRDFDAPTDPNNDGDIVPNQSFSLNSFGSAEGCFGAFPDNVSGVDIDPSHPSVPDFVACPAGSSTGCDYQYDPSLRTVTWVGAPTRSSGPQENRDDLEISFSWSNTGTEGTCGIRPSDPNAACMVTEWVDFTTEPGEFSPDAESYGVYGFVLCDRDLATCPDQ